MRRGWLALLVVGLVAIPHATPQADAGAGALPPGTGRDAVVMMCSDCHGLATAISKELTKAGWRGLVEDMAGKGAPGTDADIAAASQDLFEHFGPSNGR